MDAINTYNCTNEHNSLQRAMLETATENKF